MPNEKKRKTLILEEGKKGKDLDSLVGPPEGLFFVGTALGTFFEKQWAADKAGRIG